MVANIVCVTIGAILFLFAEHQINKMTSATCLRIRLAFFCKALGGVGLAMSPAIGDWFFFVAFGLIVSGVSLLVVFNRRDSLFGCREDDKFWRREPCEHRRLDGR